MTKHGTKKDKKKTQQGQKFIRNEKKVAITMSKEGEEKTYKKVTKRKKSK